MDRVHGVHVWSLSCAMGEGPLVGRHRYILSFRGRLRLAAPAAWLVRQRSCKDTLDKWLSCKPWVRRAFPAVTINPERDLPRGVPRQDFPRRYFPGALSTSRRWWWWLPLIFKDEARGPVSALGKATPSRGSAFWPPSQGSSGTLVPVTSTDRLKENLARPYLCLAYHAQS
jgi:hypothetical protein